MSPLSALAPLQATYAYDTSGYEFLWAMEHPLAFVSAILAAVGLWRFLPLRRNRVFTFQPNPGLGLVRLSLVFAGLWFWFIMLHGADTNIPNSMFYVFLYAALGFACLAWGAFWRPILDVYHPSDIVERGNLSAALVLVGFTLGTAFAFGGALTGNDLSCAGAAFLTDKCQAIHASATSDGTYYPPGSVGTGGWHVVLVFFLLAYLELRTSVTLVDRIGGGLSRQVRNDRDTSAGLLLGAVALACGLVAGRAAAGDYYGWGAAFADYRHRIWPIVFVPLVGCLVGFLTTDKPNRMATRALTSAVLVAGAAAWYVFT